ncbi:MAG: hypothetical protein ABI183_25490 [Polyangiaceae bacterium]
MHRRARSRHAWIVAAFSLVASAAGCRAILGVHDYSDDGDLAGADAGNVLESGETDSPLSGDATQQTDGGPCMSDPADGGYLTNATQVVTGLGFSCALLVDGDVACWGDNTRRQLGAFAKVSTSAAPKLVADVHDIKKLAAGDAHVCALSTTGAVTCWGDNASFQLGQLDPSPAGPTSVTAVSSVSDIATGAAHTCVIQAGYGLPRCWGANDVLELGHDSGTGPTPVSVTPSITPPTATTIAAGEQHACTLGTGGVACWGADDRGQLGNNVTQAAVRYTLAFAGTPTVTGVRAGGRDTCVVTTGGLYCAGTNSNGQLGGATPENPGYTATPVPLDTLDAAIDIALSGAHSCVWNADHQLYCVGDNLRGELGNGLLNVDASVIATAVTGVDGGAWFGPVISVAVAADYGGLASDRLQPDAAAYPRHSCAVLQGKCGGMAGAVYCWGSNEAGEVGNGTLKGPVLTPQAVVGVTN